MPALRTYSARSLPAINRQQFYVSISRGRQRCRIFTDDRDLLRDRLKKSAERTTALELSSLAEALREQGFNARTATKQPAAKEEVSPNATGIFHVGRTLRPLRRLRYARQLVRTLQTHLALIVARFTEHLSRSRRQSVTQHTDTPQPQHRQGISV